jgi:hypothetical protein
MTRSRCMAIKRGRGSTLRDEIISLRYMTQDRPILWMPAVRGRQPGDDKRADIMDELKREVKQHWKYEIIQKMITHGPKVTFSVIDGDFNPGALKLVKEYLVPWCKKRKWGIIVNEKNQFFTVATTRTLVKRHL